MGASFEVVGASEGEKVSVAVEGDPPVVKVGLMSRGGPGKMVSQESHSFRTARSFFMEAIISLPEPIGYS